MAILRTCYVNRPLSIIHMPVVCIALLSVVSTLKASGSASVSKRQMATSFVECTVLSLRTFRERKVPEGGDSRGCVFVQQKCRIVARLGIEHASSFLMGFLCPTCGGRYTILDGGGRVRHHNSVRLAFRNSSEMNFLDSIGSASV